MKYMNNHYGVSRIFGKKGCNLQIFAENEDEDEDEDEEDPEDESEDEDEEEPESKGDKKKGRLYTKAELGAIVAKEVEKALKEQRKKDKSKSEAEKLEEMTAEQREAYEKQQKEDRMEELLQKVARMELSKTASKLLKASDIEASDEVLDFVVGKDAEETKENIDKFVKIKDAIVLAAEKARNTGKTPKVVTGGSKKEITKDDLAKMSYKEVLAFKQKEPEKYKKLMED